MNSQLLFKINFRGGIISPGDLFEILQAAKKSYVTHVSFGLRQQLLIHVFPEYANNFSAALQAMHIKFEIDNSQYPNIVSSYPAEEVFITKTWLSEGVYKDIFDLMEYEPTLKINISDSNQSFTPLLTGNINWVASLTNVHFWHLFIRFPKTNIIYEWSQLTYTNDVAKMTEHIEKIILQSGKRFYDNVNANGEELFAEVLKGTYITKPAEAPAKLPQFNLPYYEGLNRYNDKTWLGIYKRDELFSTDFLMALCRLCLETKIGQVCSTPWKSLIVKGIEEKDRHYWNALLARHQVNMRHAANELNFQVEDNCKEGLELKKLLVNHFSINDTRTFGVCIGIKTRRKSETFSSILVKRKALLTVAGHEFFHLYDILFAKDFNPNERTEQIFISNVPKFSLAVHLQRAVEMFNNRKGTIRQETAVVKKETAIAAKSEFVYQCSNCFTVYDEAAGDEQQNIAANTAFEKLPENYCCQLCETGKEKFVKVNKTALGVAV